MEIVYCGGCGKVLRGDDFTKGLARFDDNRPWCAECKPPDKAPIPVGTTSIKRTGSSAKLPRITPGTARRETAPEPISRNVFIGLGVAGTALLIGAFYVMSGGSTPPPPSSIQVKAVKPPLVIAKPSGSAESERLLKELESFASLSPPDRILARCEEIRISLRGTPQEKRFKEIEAAAMEQKKLRESEGQYVRESDAVRKLIDEDPRFEKYDEVLRRLRALKDLAGPRRAEVERRTEEYLKDRKDSPHEKHAGPYAEDEGGFIRNWLLLGAFPSEGGKAFESDLLGGESGQDPTDGMAAGKRKWASYASAESKIDFFRVPHLKLKKPKDDVIVYAACSVQVLDSVAAEFWMGSDDAVAVWVDGKEIRRFPTGRSLKIDEDRIAVPLSRGTHRVLAKVMNFKGEFEFILRIVTPDGMRIGSLRVWN